MKAKSKFLPKSAFPIRAAIPNGSLTDREKIEAAAGQKSLELLYDYTKWHIGAYLTLGGAYLTAAFAKIADKLVLTLNLHFVILAVLFTMFAGFAGGVIVSSLTQYHEGSSTEFLNTEIGPWGWKKLWLKAKLWTYIEHTSFWIGLMAAGLSFFIPAHRWEAMLGCYT